MEKTRILIIGSGGFISSGIEKNLKKNKEKFYLLPRKKINLLKLSQVNKLNKIIKKNDSILFIAAKAPVKNIRMFNSNIKMLINFSKILDKNNFKKLIYLSSDAVYSDSKSKLFENSRKEPQNLHGLMHLTRENIFKNIIERKKLLILRPTLVYGKNDPHNGYGPNKFYRNVLNNEDINIFGKGEERRDHVWVEDVAEIISRVVDLEYIGKINITSGKIISFSQIAEILLNLNSSSIKIKYLKRNGPMPHNGYRAFKNNKLLSIFGDFKFKNLNEWFQEELSNEN